MDGSSVNTHPLGVHIFEGPGADIRCESCETSLLRHPYRFTLAELQAAVTVHRCLRDEDIVEVDRRTRNEYRTYLETERAELEARGVNVDRQLVGVDQYVEPDGEPLVFVSERRDVP